MSTYVQISGGFVAELFTPPTGFTIAECFHAGLTWVDVTTVTPQPQPGWPATETAGVWTFEAPPAPPAPTAAQTAALAYAALLAGGLTVTSTDTPALSGVYAIDPAAQADIAVEAQFISTFAEFTNGSTSNLDWVLANGSIVTFPTTTEFLAFAKQAGKAVAAAKLALARAGAMPAATATIA